MNRITYPSSKRSSKSRPASQWNYREDDDEEEEDDEEEVDLPDSDDDVDYGVYRNRISKIRKVDDFTSGYEFRPRGNHRAPSEWTENSTYVLLDAWGERFLQLGRSSLRGEDWSEVADRVSEITGVEFSVLDCRNRLNEMKNKYKKERAKLKSKWSYFKKMDLLMTMPPRQQQQCGLACGVDSGEFVFMDPRVYLDCSNAVDEMRDSTGEEEDEEGEEEEEDLESYRMLSESIKRVGEIYEKIESSKRESVMELERMRMEFQRDVEVQKKEMMETTRGEIERIRREGGIEEDGDVDLEDADGSPHSGSE